MPNPVFSRLQAIVLGGVALLLAAGPAAAQMQPLKDVRSHLLEGGRSLLLFPRERVVLRLAPDGGLKIVSASAADPAHALPTPGRADDATAPIREAEPGTIAVLMGAVGNDTLLMIASGVQQAFDYRAAFLVEAGRPELTPLKVCTVLPLLPSYEQWKDTTAPVIMLTGFKARPTNEVLCPEPPKVVRPPAAKAR